MKLLSSPTLSGRLITLTVLLLSLSAFPAIDLGAQVSGTVYFDFNTSGARENMATYDEPGYAGLTVTGYGADGTVYGPVTTAADGTYTLAGVNQPTRIEFTWMETWLYPSVAGPTSVQFVAGAATGVDLGVLYPGQYATPDTADVDMIVSCFVNGDPLLFTGPPPFPSDGSAIARQAYGTSGGPTDVNDANSIDPPPQLVARAGEVGSVFGLAWSARDRQLYSAAFVKRHSGMGDLGIGGIYRTDLRAATPGNAPFVDLVALGINVGTIPSNTARQLPGSVTFPSNDPAAFAATAAVGLGDIDISDDGRTLYVVNLFEKRIVAITLDADDDPGTPPTAADVTSFPVPAVSCTAGNYRPFGLKFFRERLYLGGVCDGDDGTPSNDVNDPANENMFGYVHQFDPADPTAAGIEVLDFPLFTTQSPPADEDYPHVGLSGGNCGFATRNWHPWRGTYPQLFSSCNGTYQWPTPFIADLEFDYDGSMIVGIGDRMGLQIGNDNYGLTGSTPTSAFAGGDVLRAYPTSATNWELEANGDKDGPGPYVATADQNQGAGPGGGEFYWGDRTPGFHLENAMGGLGFYPGTDEIILTTVDPPRTIFSNGVNYLSNTDGDFNFPGNGGGYPFFYLPGGSGRLNQSKSTGLGDIELTQDVPPLEIGNYVWLDMDMDGIQDADETALVGVTLELWVDTDGDGVADTKVAETTTDANGNYLFSDNGPNVYGTEDWSFTAANEVQPFTAYEIRVPTTVSTGGAIGSLTTTDAETTTDNSPRTDIRDSDASPAGVIALTTGGDGAINHGFDVGFSPGPPPVVSLGDTAFVDLNANGLQDPGDAPLSGVTVTLYQTGADTIVTTDAAGTPLPGTVPGTTVTDATGAYSFDDLPPGDYYVVFDIGTSANAEFYAFTTPNVGTDDAVDSDGVMLTPTTAESGPTGPLAGGQRDSTLDVGVVCNPGVTVPAPFAVCATATIDLRANFAINPAVAGFGGTYTVVETDSDGVFLDAAGAELTAPFAFGTAAGFRVGAADAARGSVTLRLTTDDPPGDCPAVSNEVTITIRKVDCGDFPWGGE